MTMALVSNDDGPRGSDSGCSRVHPQSARPFDVPETFPAPRTLPDVLLSCAGGFYLCA